MFDLAARIIVMDGFSVPLDTLDTKTQQAERSLEGMSTAVDQPARLAKAQIADLTRTIDQLRAKAKSGQPLTVLDLEQFRAASGALQTTKADLEGLTGGGLNAAAAMQKLYLATLGSAAAFSALRLGAAVYDLTLVGAQAQAVESVFTNLTRSMGVNADRLIAEMQKAARGTVDETTLMITANRALLAGGAELADKLPRLFEIARAASLATGQDVQYVFETLVRGVAKASPLLIDNADIYIKIGDAVDAYAAASGRTADQLGLVERRMAIANAVLEQGGAFIERMGLESETAADRMQNLPAAVRDLKSAIGELLAETGLDEFLSRLAGGIRSGLDAKELNQQFDDLYDTLVALGDVGPAKGWRAELIGLDDELLTARRRGEDGAQAYLKYNQALQELVARVDEYTQGIQASKDPEAAFYAGLKRSQEAFRAMHGEMDVSALQTFNQVMGELGQKSTGVQALAEQVAQIANATDVLAAGLPALPQIGDNLLATDTAALREYLQALAQVRPELAAVTGPALQHVEALEKQQQAALAAAQAANWSAGSLQKLALQAGVADGSILGLVEKLDQMPPAMQEGIDKAALLSAALAELQVQAAQPITVDVAVSGLERAQGQIDAMALRLANVLSPEQIRSFRERARSDIEQHWLQMGQTDQFGMDLLLAQEVGGYQDLVSNQLSADRKMESEAKRHAEVMGLTAGEMQSAIQSALKFGTEVTPLDMLQAQLGVYEDKALESVRRLDAIAQRGFAELKAHPDWAAALKIPPEVLGGTENALKAWALQTRQDVQDLARPDLIDWDAFVRQFERIREREAATELTLDIAVGKLQAAGLFEGESKEDIKKKVAQQLGLEAPELTFKAMFEVPEPAAARGRMVTDLLAGQPALPVPARAELQPITPEDMAQWIGFGLTVPVMISLQDPTPEQVAAAQAAAEGAVPGQFDLSVTRTILPDMAAPGQDLAGKLYTSFQTAVEAQDYGAALASAISADVAANGAMFETIGTSIGGQISRAVADGAEAGAADVVGRIARAVAPEVWAIIQRMGGYRPPP